MHAVHAELVLDARGLGNERMPVVGIHEERADHDERDDHGDLDRDDDVVDGGGFGHADHQQHRDRQHDEHRGQVEQRRHDDARSTGTTAPSGSCTIDPAGTVSCSAGRELTQMRRWRDPAPW